MNLLLCVVFDVYWVIFGRSTLVTFVDFFKTKRSWYTGWKCPTLPGCDSSLSTQSKNGIPFTNGAFQNPLAGLLTCASRQLLSSNLGTYYIYIWEYIMITYSGVCGIWTSLIFGDIQIRRYNKHTWLRQELPRFQLSLPGNQKGMWCQPGCFPDRWHHICGYDDAGLPRRKNSQRQEDETSKMRCF